MTQRFFIILAAVSLAALPAGANCPSMTWSGIQTLTNHEQWVENIRAIDYDNDNKLDLVGSIRNQNTAVTTLSSWKGNGDATFQTAVSMTTDSIVDIEIADMNNDGRLDIVGTRGGNGIFVRLNSGVGTFDPPVTTTTNFAAYDLSIANFNNDSYPDILVTSSALFVLYTGNANGTFTEVRRQTVATTDPYGGDVWKGEAKDFDNDGYIDVVVTLQQTNFLKVYFRNSNGTFVQTPVSLTTSEQPRDLHVADFNEDGLLDLANSSWAGRNIDVFLNNGSRAFASKLSLSGRKPGGWGNLDSMIVTDIDGDANVDIVAAGVNNSQIITYLGRGNGTFSTASFSDIADGGADIIAANLDNDSELEVAVGTYGELITAGYTCETQVTMYSLAPTISVGQAAKLRAHVSGITSAMNPRGTVTFKEGSTTLGTGDVDANGFASFDYTGFAAGDHVLTAEFGGNGTLSPDTSPNYTQTVINQTTSITITLGASTHGEPFNSTVTVTNRFGFAVEGWYVLTIDGVTEASQRWSGAPLSLTLSAGPHTISAEYAGDTYDPPSTSQVYNFTTAKHAVTMTRTGETTVPMGQSHTIQFAIGATTSPAPTGSVQLFRGATLVGTQPLSGGSAQFYLTLQRGSADYTAVYSGDANYLANSNSFELNVVGNTPVAIDAYALPTKMAIPAVVPAGTTATTLYRRVSGTNEWTVVGTWSLASPYDTTGLTRGVLYDYRLDATVSGNVQQSNIDSALLFTDPTITAGSTVVKRIHFAEIRESVNALRAAAGLAPITLNGTFGSGLAVRASHLTTLRNGVSEARTVLGMTAMTFTDPSPSGATIKVAHINDLREAGR